jgi:ABC-type nitrate/sulfonate/bicarbonate transport system permease component
VAVPPATTNEQDAFMIWQRITDSSWTYRLITFVVLAGLWQWYAIAVGGLLIPTFHGTVIRLGEMFFEPALWRAVWISNQSLFIGFALSIILGIPLGLLMGRFRGAEKFTDVYINILLVTPMAAIIPLLIMSPLGFGLASRVILVILFSIPMVLVNSRAGVRQVDPNLIEMSHSFGANEYELWKRIILPGSLPAIMTGIRLGLGRAITAMVIVELLMVAVGLGGLIVEARGRFDPNTLYAVVIFIVLEALLLVSIARRIERRLVPWAREGILAD